MVHKMSGEQLYYISTVVNGWPAVRPSVACPFVARPSVRPWMACDPSARGWSAARPRLLLIPWLWPVRACPSVTETCLWLWFVRAGSSVTVTRLFVAAACPSMTAACLSVTLTRPSVAAACFSVLSSGRVCAAHVLWFCDY